MFRVPQPPDLLPSSCPTCDPFCPTLAPIRPTHARGGMSPLRVRLPPPPPPGPLTQESRRSISDPRSAVEGMEALDNRSERLESVPIVDPVDSRWCSRVFGIGIGHPAAGHSHPHDVP